MFQVGGSPTSAVITSNVSFSQNIYNFTSLMASASAEPAVEDEAEAELEPEPSTSKITNTSDGATKLRSWLNKTLKIEMTDGRVLIGIFFCTDRDANIILGSCSEYLPADPESVSEEPRMLGLVMVPGKHIVSVHFDQNFTLNKPMSAGASWSNDVL